MKFKGLFFLMVIFVFIGCKEEPNDPIYCPDINGNGHLGIGENCIKDTGDCSGLKNYNTSTGANAFPKPIYRVGPLSGFDVAKLTKTANDVMNANPTALGMSQGDKQRLDERLNFVQIYSAGEVYTWKDKVLGMQAGIDSDWVEGFIGGIASSSNLAPTAQIQMLNRAILMAGSKDAKNLIAGGGDKEPKLNTVAQNFRMNCQAVIRNNRINKNLLCA